VLLRIDALCSLRFRRCNAFYVVQNGFFEEASNAFGERGDAIEYGTFLRVSSDGLNVWFDTPLSQGDEDDNENGVYIFILLLELGG
jgi:hypothetical protein